MYAKIVVDIYNQNDLYTYRVPQELEKCIYIGSRVFVEFGFQKVLGYVIEIIDEVDFSGNLKDILEVVDFDFGLSNEQILLAEKIAKETLTTLPNSLELMYPSFMRSRLKKSLKVLNFDNLDAEVALLINGRQSIPIDNKILSLYGKIKKEIDLGNLELKTDIYTYGKRKYIRHYYVLNNKSFPKTLKQQLVYNYLQDKPESTSEEIIQNTNASEYIINKLVRDKVISFVEKIPVVEKTRLKRIHKPDYNFEEENLIQKYFKTNPKPYLFHTNDHKFKLSFLYEAINAELKNNKKVLIVTPTILDNSLYTKYFEQYFYDKNVVSFSSKISNSDFYYNYIELINNNVDLIITTKVGTFFPLTNIGLIILVDPSNKNYINEQNPKFNTTNILKDRAEYHGSKIIFVTSSPSVEEYYNYTFAKYIYLPYINENLKRNVHLTNLRTEFSSTLLSKKLSDALVKNFEDKKVSMLVVNNLSYNQTTLCSKCSSILKCPECSVGLVYQLDKRHYRCYSCNYTTQTPECECGSNSFKFFGFGLEKLRETLLGLIPGVRIAKVDSVEFINDDDYDDFYSSLEEKEIDIIIGTYPVLNFVHEDIKLVGILDIDNLLNKNDYRSSEEVFNIITKLSSNNGDIYLQGYNLNHFSVISAINNDFISFYEQEIKNRKLYKYPPFVELNKLIIIGDYKDIYYYSNYFKKVFSKIIEGNVLGPVYIKRVKGIQLIIKHNDYTKLYRLIEEVNNKFKDRKIITNFEKYPKLFY